MCHLVIAKRVTGIHNHLLNLNLRLLTFVDTNSIPQCGGAMAMAMVMVMAMAMARECRWVCRLRQPKTGI